MTAKTISINTLSQAIGGGVAVARNLTAAMARERPKAAFNLFCSNREVADSPYPVNVAPIFHPALCSLPLRIAWEQIKLPRVLAQLETDVLLNLGGFCVFATEIPQVAVWQNPNIYTRIPIRRSAAVRMQIALQRFAQYRSMRKSKLNIFLSRDSVRECATRWPMHEIPHQVIYPGIESDSDPEIDATPIEIDRPFALAVGHSYFHKNYAALIDAMDAYRAAYGEGLALVIAGGAVDDSHHRQLLDSIESRKLSETVHFLGATPRNQVRNLYRRATVYVTTTLLESFGLTPLEAMLYGVPTLVSNTSCLPEVCEDAVLYCDPHDPAEIARKLHDLCSDEALREGLRERGFERVKRFSWERCARDHLAALDRCVAS